MKILPEMYLWSLDKVEVIKFWECVCNPPLNRDIGIF